MHAAGLLFVLLVQQPDSGRAAQPDTMRAIRDTTRAEQPDTTGPQEPDTMSLAPTAAHLADAYEDEIARDLVQRARERRRTVDHSIDAYEAVARERISASLRLPGRDRTLYRRETATRIDWKREGPIRLEVLGSREVIPPVRGAPQIPEDLRNFVPHLAFDPVDSEVLLRLNDDFLRNPLAVHAERHYRFRSGDTTQIRLPDGRTVRLVELRITPRRSDSDLLQGSFWLEQETNAVVQAVFRPARPYDLEEDEDEDVPGLLKPVRFELEYITLEYAFWDFRWWLPRTLAAEGVLQVSRLFRMPFGYSLSYSDYEVEGDPTAQRLVVDADSLDQRSCTAGGSMRIRVRAGDDDDDAEDDRHEETDIVASADTAASPADSVARSEDDPAAAHDSTEVQTRGMHVDEETGRGTDRCGRVLQVDLPPDSATLLTSEYLPPTIYETDANWEDERRRVRELVDLLGDIDEAPWRAPAPTFAWGLGAPGLVRYNRVEGLSLGARGDLDLGRLRFDATARLALAEPRPDIEVGVTRPTTARDYRLAAYTGIRAVDPSTRAFGLGNSFNALLLGRDDAEYYEALGVSLDVRPALTNPQWYQLRAFAERHDDVAAETDFSLPGVFDGERTFRPNIIASEADLFGGELVLNGGIGTNPEGWRASATLALDGAGGDFEFGRSALTLRTAIPLFANFSVALEAAAGSSLGDVPVQRLFYLGGPGTLRGYGGNAVRGDGYWRGRAELSRGMPAARLALFGDLGWAGDRDAFNTSQPIRAVGIGATVFDGLVRADLARALDGDESWRFDLWVSIHGY